MTINFAHIAPVAYLPFVKQYPVHLLLAHLVEENADYRNFYINLKKENPNVFYHLDNSAFEMFKRGVPMYESSKLLKMADIIQADTIVMSDYPKEHWSKTVESAEKLIPLFKSNGYKTFFCPQSTLGDLEGLMKGLSWGIENPDVDIIGISILNCPIALNVNETKHGPRDNHTRDDSYRMQRYMSRWAIFEEMRSAGLLSSKTNKRFHCLGMTDGPREISLLREFHQHIFSWDSSTAIWHAINGIKYDSSPTGLKNGKYEAEVDFDIPLNLTSNDTISYNMSRIDSMCKGE